ncbi:MAG: flagellar hook-associated protein FlgK [Oscillospiraceae bacterium]|jgi:flagellar hook-associated protein 1 FlgK|nr:flagellar hook-associated protein FlgK [Oscillospiraceae bacterium]
MRATFSGLEIGRTGLVVAQKGLDITGHNIANVNTEGYTRQRMIQTAIDPYNPIRKFRPVENGIVGQGTKVMILDQIRSEFLDSQYRANNAVLGYWDTRMMGLSYIEPLLEGTDDITLQRSLTEFFAALKVGETEASDEEQRKLIQQSALALINNFNLTYTRLQEQMYDQNLAVEMKVDEINTYAEQLAELNKVIFSYEIINPNVEKALDLRDKRNVILDKLSQIADIKYHEDADGYFSVWIVGSDGVQDNENLLVSHVNVNHMSVAKRENVLPGEPDVWVPVWATYDEYPEYFNDSYDPPRFVGAFDADGTYIGPPAVAADDDVPGAVILANGSLQAHIDLRDGVSPDTMGIPYFMERLNNFVRALAQEFNNQHAEGWTHIRNADHDSTPGGEFFTFREDANGNIMYNCAGFSLSDEIKDDIYKIAFSNLPVVDDEADYIPGVNVFGGNQENMRSLYQLLDKTEIYLDDPGVAIGTLHGFLTTGIFDLAASLHHAKQLAENQNTQTGAVDNMRQSISGVSLDDEMVNMIKYQHAYEGASRIITTMDEALDILINRMGLVGRS